MEGLRVMVNRAVDLSLFGGVQVWCSRSTCFRSHLQFADDTLLVCKKSKRNLWAIKATLQIFEVVPGLKVNFHKSQLMGLNVDVGWLQNAAYVLNCKVGAVPFRYMGLPVGANPKKLSTWAPVVDTVKQRLSVWKCKNLSFGGRIVLIKSVLTALLIFYLSFFKAPTSIISQLEILFKQFLWDRDGDIREFIG